MLGSIRSSITLAAGVLQRRGLIDYKRGRPWWRRCAFSRSEAAFRNVHPPKGGDFRGTSRHCTCCSLQNTKQRFAHLLHDRMPVIIPAKDYYLWLNAALVNHLSICFAHSMRTR